MISVGIIGLGFMGYTHYQVYKSHPAARVVAICDGQERRRRGDWSDIGGNLGDGARACEDLSGMRVTADPAELINDPAVDLVDICVRTDLHCELALAALAAGKHVLLEKPMALGSAQCRRIVEAARVAPGRLMVAHCIRFWPENAWIKRAIAAQAYGPVRELFLRRIASPPGYAHQNWLMNAAASGGALFDLHIHDVDYMLYLMGRPRSVHAWGDRGPSGAVDAVHAQFEFEGGAHATVIGGWAYHLPWRMEVLARCESATLVFETHTGNPLSVWLPDGRRETPAVEPGDGYAREIDYFLTCLEAGIAPEITTPEDAAETIELLEAENRSIAGGGVIDLGRGAAPAAAQARASAPACAVPAAEPALEGNRS